jgi:UDP-N-acetylmuramoylalanine--D-glutamate ligase
MELKNKNILLIGFGKTGISTLKFLNKMGANVIVNDSKKENEMTDILSLVSNIEDVEYTLGKELEDLSNIDLVIVSPGIALDTDYINKIRNNNIEIIGDIELAYRCGNNPAIIAITGTNGKTTTTTLVGEIMKKINNDTYVVGNIGNPIMDTVTTATNSSCLVAELSSFQLESIKYFRPDVSIILNITPDHLNRHKTMQSYIDAKANIFKNQKDSDITILNYDDKNVRTLSKSVKGRLVFFSRKEKLNNGVYINNDGDIIISYNGDELNLMNKSEVSLPGNHNLENILATIAAFASIESDLELVKKSLRTFKGVEHRQEFVKEENGITFVNDSKATNPDSTIKAIESYKNPVILIAGGYDKGGDFYDVIKAAMDNSVKALVLLGETKERIESQANELGFDGLIIKTQNIKDAINVSKKIAKSGDIILLSPACASMDMYKNFEERGRDFKANC